MRRTAVGFVHVVRRDENREVPFGLDLAEHLPPRHVTPDRVGGRLVEKEDARLVHEAARGFDAAPHPGEILHLRIAPLREFDRLGSSSINFTRLARGTPYSFAKMISSPRRSARDRWSSLGDDANRSPDAVGLFDHRSR
jgi:hypothetical protein